MSFWIIKGTNKQGSDNPGFTVSHTIHYFKLWNYVYYFDWFVLLVLMPFKVGIKFYRFY